MLFSDLIDYLKNEKTFNIILNCSTDLHEIRDVELAGWHSNRIRHRYCLFWLSRCLVS